MRLSASVLTSSWRPWSWCLVLGLAPASCSGGGEDTACENESFCCRVAGRLTAGVGALVCPVGSGFNSTSPHATTGRLRKVTNLKHTDTDARLMPKMILLDFFGITNSPIRHLYVQISTPIANKSKKTWPLISCARVNKEDNYSKKSIYHEFLGKPRHRLCCTTPSGWIYPSTAGTHERYL